MEENWLQNFFNKVTKKALQEHFRSAVLPSLNSHIHVQYVVGDNLLRNAVADHLEELSQGGALTYQVIANTSEIHQPLGKPRKTVWVSSRILPIFGAITMGAPGALSFLPPVQKMIFEMVNERSLEHCLDVFDRELVAELKVLLASQGFEIFAHLVIQICYVGGQEGDEASLRALIRCAHNQQFVVGKSPRDLTWETFLSAFDAALCQDLPPHEFLKIALSYFVVKRRSKTITDASLRLKVSRSTIQEHLRLAQKYEFKKLFDV